MRYIFTSGLALSPARVLVLALALLLTTGSTQADDQDPENLVNYAFATWIGTGVYKVSGSSLSIISMPFSAQVRDTEANRFGIKALFPITLGSHDFNGLDNVQTVTFVPGAEFHLRIRDNWVIKPFGQAGLGNDFSSGELTFIGGTGIKSLVDFPWRDFTFSLGNMLLLAGSQSTGGNNARGFSRFDIGLNAHHPLDFNVFGRPASLGLFYIFANYIKDVDLQRFERDDISIRRLHHVGFTVGTRPSFRIWRFRIPRFGLTYVWGDGLRGMRLNGGFPF